MLHNLEWKPAPINVWIQCKQIRDKVDQPYYEAFKEYIVHFSTNGLYYTAFVPEEFVDASQCLLAAKIVAEYGQDLLVDIPVETLTSGTRLRVSSWEKDNILKERVLYGTERW